MLAAVLPRLCAVECGQKNSYFFPVAAGMVIVSTGLAASKVTNFFALCDVLPAVLESSATSTWVGQHRSRSFRAQGVLRDACIAFHPKPPHSHTT